ncbi:alpha-galactosidase [Colletotrichum orchidophilum]|uniref:Alpha-galactosidase n=1 Tax=Colletotrichum orchidophilum TaxID=1209926 RepID=A0A1G4BKH5_9PEZI|nr:alpha-galactosidase [Colletotrichum orchidophilum]OHF01797.1 alpha-galactosidase [Colletotrichum orchidophilum]
MHSAILAAVGLSSTAAALVSGDGKTGRLPALGGPRGGSMVTKEIIVDTIKFLQEIKHTVDQVHELELESDADPQPRHLLERAGRSTGSGAMGTGNMLEGGNGNLTLQESRTHFVFWAVLKSPLIIGTQVEGIQPEIMSIRSILSIEELVTLDQDPKFGTAAQPLSGALIRTGRGIFLTWPSFGPGVSVEGAYVLVLNTLSGAVEKNRAFKNVPFLGLHGRELERHDMAALRINVVKCVKRTGRE